MGAQDREVYFVFGSVCRVLSGKIPLKEWKTTVQDIWSWSLQTTRDLNGTALDVPYYPPPATTLPTTVPPSSTTTTLPPPPTNGSPDPVLQPPAEKPVTVPNPAPIPSEQGVCISAEQAVRFVAHAYKQGFSEMGLIRYLKSQGINTPSQIPLSKARDLWNAVREPTLVQQYQ